MERPDDERRRCRLRRRLEVDGDADRAGERGQCDDVDGRRRRAVARGLDERDGNCLLLSVSRAIGESCRPRHTTGE
jgi:hypothetical protein